MWRYRYRTRSLDTGLKRWFVNPDWFNLEVDQPGSLVVVAVHNVFNRSFAHASISGFCFSYARTWYTWHRFL